MSRQKKNTTIAQVSTEKRSDAAIKLFPQTSKIRTKHVADPVDGDSDGPDETEIALILIEVASNGYLLTFTLEDGTEEKSVHIDFNDVLSAIRSRY